MVKAHKELWKKRNEYDLIVVFDIDSSYQTIREIRNHPVNIVRECTIDCLTSTSTDLPKVRVVCC